MNPAEVPAQKNREQQAVLLATASHQSQQLNWHALASAELLNFLSVVAETGLNDTEVKTRQAQHGKNELSGKRSISAFKRLLLQFAQPLMYILVIAAVITASIGEIVDAAVITGVVIINALVGYLQEAKAEQADRKSVV